MALEDDLQQPGSPARSESGPRAPALEERVARLEREFETLRRQMASASVATTAPLLIPEIQIPAAPPPRPEEAWVPPPIPSPQLHPVKARGSFENRLGSEIFNRIGIVLLLIGTAWFLKLAVDRQWIVPSPTGRVIAGLLAGAGFVLWSERFRRKGFAPFSYSLKALGSGVLYLSLWAAFHIYHLLPASAALALMILVTAWNAWMAWAQNSELLAAYALAGGFASPMLLSTGGNHETFLFTYLLAIDLATVALVRLRAWPRLLLGAFPLTVAFYIAWYAEFFTAAELTLTAVFVVLFGSTFASVPIRLNSDAAGAVAPRANRSTLIEEILLPLANAAFVALALYSVLQDSGHHSLLPWLMIALAAVYLGFMRLPQSRAASAIHLSLAVVLLTIAVPLKASGHWITASWLVEGLALLWVATRLTGAPEGPRDDYAPRVLRLLASGALALGFCGVVFHSGWAGFGETTSFFNADMGTALTGVAVFAAAAWLALRSTGTTAGGSRSWMMIVIAALIAIDSIALLLALRELVGEKTPLHPPFQTADFFTALVGLAVFAGVIGVSSWPERLQPDRLFWRTCAAGSTIAFNLVAVLTGVREIEAIWVLSSDTIYTNLDAPLKEALAISGFLMLYGAALLAVGFWKRSAFLRWQGLLLLVFTIFKAFLYDMRSLSQGYRVVSFLGLGALLMAISFAYQKDWLNLRGPAIAEGPDASSEAAR